jgi:hypothetical protein
MAGKDTSNPVGRPTSMTEATLGKLEEAFAFDATVEEACFYADINPDTYYVYVKAHPEFSERVKALRQRPVLKARQTIVTGLDEPKNAQWYLERKRKQEFGANLLVDQGDNPIRILLEAYGLGGDDDTKTDESIQSSSTSQT